MDQSFPSLVDDEVLTEDSFWPSFTDILTVIVMIFLMAMLVLLLRNMDLIARLQDTITQKEYIFAQSEQIKQRNNLLLHELQQSETRRIHLQEQQQAMTARLEQETLLQIQQKIKLQQQQRQLTELQQKIAAQRTILATKTVTIEAQETNMQRIEARYDMARSSLMTVTAEAAGLRTELDTAQFHANALQHDLDSLRQRDAKVLKDTLNSLQVARIELNTHAQKLRQLKDEYSNLHARYVQLLRPARSPKNKHVVEVLYNSEGVRRIYGLREDHTSAWKKMPRNALEQQLASLKQQYGAKLYVRIMIPDDSDISFNEAWDFTHQMLKRYDYYHGSRSR